MSPLAPQPSKSDFPPCRRAAHSHCWVRTAGQVRGRSPESAAEESREATASAAGLGGRGWHSKQPEHPISHGCPAVSFQAIPVFLMVQNGCHGSRCYTPDTGRRGGEMVSHLLRKHHTHTHTYTQTHTHTMSEGMLLNISEPWLLICKAP